jgi:hypothetical protein
MTPKRVPATDTEVMSYIRAQLDRDPKARHTRLLREYRGAGYACEQSRFRDLFHQVTKERAK